MPNLVGIGNSQVPTNAMLGGLAYQDSVGEIDIDKIKARTSDTATDVFVYDTSKDSDGGAWRHRTQNTSWYNEGASATRGARKEFPAVAVIVCFTSGLAIYDGDDPNLPLWMEWTTTNGTYMLRGPTSGRIAAMNGIIALSSAGTYGGMVAIYLISDTSRSYRQLGSNNKSEGYFIGNGIADRNSFSGNCYSNAVGGNILPALVDENSKDVAITVLPNAPTDPDTGLPIPTIALATIGGTSIIKDDGTAVSIVYTGGPSTAYVDFRKSDNAIVMSMNSNGSYVHVIYDIPSSNISGSHQYQKEGIDNEFYRTGSSSDWNQDVWIYAASPFGGSTVRIVNNVISGNGGINVLSPSKTAPATDTMVARITSSFNSGYLHGDIKGAYLADTDATDLVASNLELVTNGTFDSDSNWTKDGSWTISGGTATNSGGGNINQTIAVVSGKRYLMTATMDFTGDTSLGNTTIGFRDTSNSSYYAFANTATFNANTVNYLQLYWTSNVTGNVLARCYSSDGVSIDNWSVQSVDGQADRAKENKGLQVFGTIQKDPVATGAELVAYHGFSGGNYLRQPYNSDLNFSTGDFSIIVWVKKNTLSTNHYIIDRATTAPSWGGSSGRSYFIINSNGYHRFKLAGGNEVSGTAVKMPTGVYNQIGFVRRSGAMEFWMNGKLVQTITGSNASASFDASVTNQTMTVNRFANGFAYDYTFDRMALLRIGGDAPSASQMKKMYEDEKCLFHENAKCTLHGTSDAVTALAFDDTNDILHVGTSAGRSEFQGLNRINNTTTAVTTAISASNKLVAEQ